MMLHGYDISAFQAATWTKACDFLFVKATEGDAYTSSRFASQWAGAKDHAKVRGAYHFARPEQSSYKDQAKRFLDTVQPSSGEPMALDLEASKLTQSATNTWARNWGDYIANEMGEQQDIYLGSGYASNGTGRDLSKHFRHWWYPQYPSAYQVASSSGSQPYEDEAQRAANRSEASRGRLLVAAATSMWPPSVSPWLPSGITTGWEKPHLWQFTDNFGGLDASITALTVEQLAGGTVPSPPPGLKPPKWPGRYLKLASPLMHGSDVKYVQERLNAHGASPKLKVDSEYGPKTRDAVRAFQRKQHLAVDGVVGKLTWNALAK